MNRHSKRPARDADPVHPLETLLAHVSADSVDPIDDAHADVWAREVRAKVDGQLAALRRQLNPPRGVARRAARIDDELRALDRDGLLARLAVLRQAPEVRIAHLELSGLTTDDLRQLVAEIETERTQA